MLESKIRKHGVDWIVTDEAANLFIECKTKRLGLDAKFVVEGSGLHDAIDAMAGYIVQHYKNILDALDGKTVWRKNDKPCFAAIITLEDWWIFTPTIVNMLDNSIKALLAAAQIETNILEKIPYAVASIDELEIAMQIVSETGILSFFSSKTDAEHRTWAVSPFASSEYGDVAKKAHRRLFADEFFNYGKPPN